MRPKFSKKCSLQAICWIFSALPGAQHLKGVSPFPTAIVRKHMTRRAFLALRVIQRQGKFDLEVLVKNWCKWLRKMKIARNLWVRLTSEQFSRLDQVTTYPDGFVVSVYALYKNPSWRIGFCMRPKFSKKCSLRAICWKFSALPEAQHLERCFALAKGSFT